MQDEQEPTESMDSTASGWIQWLHPRAAGTVFLASTILVLLPDHWVSRAGLGDLRRAYLHWIVLALVVSFASLIISGIPAGREYLRRHFDNHRMRRRLHDLTLQEKAVLRRYINGRTRTQNFDMRDGVVAGLVEEHILYRPYVSGTIESIAVNIQPWAWDYLNKNREILGS